MTRLLAFVTFTDGFYYGNLPDRLIVKAATLGLLRQRLRTETGYHVGMSLDHTAKRAERASLGQLNRAAKTRQAEGTLMTADDNRFKPTDTKPADLLEWDSTPSIRDGRRGWEAPVNEGQSRLRIEEYESCWWRLLLLPEDEEITVLLTSRGAAKKAAEHYNRRTYLKRKARP
jgi:hypothetical protein